MPAEQAQHPLEVYLFLGDSALKPSSAKLKDPSMLHFQTSTLQSMYLTVAWTKKVVMALLL